MSVIAWIVGSLLLLLLVAQRLLFLAPTRLGWITYFANIGSEVFERRLRWSRRRVELGVALAGLALLWGGGASAALVGWVGLGLAVLEIYARAPVVDAASPGRKEPCQNSCP